MNFKWSAFLVIIIFLAVSFFSKSAYATVISDPSDGDISELTETELVLKLEDPPNNSVAIQLRLEIQGGEIIDFEEDSGFFAGPQCPDTPSNTNFTENEVCVDLVKGSNLVDGDILGILTISRFSGQTLTINKTEDNLYVLDDSSLLDDEAELVVFNEGLTSNVGGNSNDNFTINDSSITPTPIVNALPATGLVDDLLEDNLLFGFLIICLGLFAFTYIYTFSRNKDEETY